MISAIKAKFTATPLPSYTNVISSRALDTEYTNTNPYRIWVCGEIGVTLPTMLSTGGGGGSAIVSINVDSVTLFRVGAQGGSNGGIYLPLQFSFFVNPNSTYKLVPNIAGPGTLQLDYISELPMT
tara:strand:+ start:873 stop:1247 length:375 start_codon:yes stop_codon:yes gene_type:complete